MDTDIAFHLVSTGGGADRLVRTIYEGCRQSLRCTYTVWPSGYRLFPPLLRVRPGSHAPAAKLVQTDIFGSPFRQHRAPLSTLVYHLFDDPTFDDSKKSPAQRLYHRLLRSHQDRTLRSSDHVIAISRYTQSVLRDLKNVDARHVRCGIDTAFFKPTGRERRPGPTRLFFAGNLIVRKGADLLPRIMAALGPGFELRFTSGLRERVPSEFRASNMLPVGSLSRERLRDEYEQCDIFLFPTRLEGFGLAVAEAMACERPVVSTRCSSLPELVDDGQTGLLCEPDRIDDFVEKIRSLADDPERRAVMGGRAREKIERDHSEPAMVRDYLQLYGEILGR